MRKFFTRRALPGKAALLSVVLAGAVATPAAAQTAYGLATSANPGVTQLVTFSVTSPGTLTSTVVVTGLTTGQTLVGLDTRPATGELFALGYNPTGTQAQLYAVNRTTAVLTAVGSALTLNLGTNLNRIGFDFNPTVDRIRVTSGARTNYRLNPANGALAATDGMLTYAVTDANANQVPSVSASAYTNSYIGATGTTLYNIDAAANRLVTQVPPNDGTQNTVATLTGVSASTAASTDLDIYFAPASGSTAGANVAYLAASVVGTATTNASLYTLNLTTGAATSVGAIGPAAVNVYNIALAIDRTVPVTVTGQLAYALAGTNLITFDTALPGTIRTSVGITGVDVNQTLVGLDVRPANNALYALGYDAVGQSNNSQLYTINPTTGAATRINVVGRLELGTGSIGFDFNPTVDRIRVVGANRTNYRLNPTPGAAPLATTDGTLTYATGTNVPNIGAAAYTNSFPGAGSTSTTTLYTYDETLNTLNTQNPPNDGTQNTVGSSGIVVNTSAPTAINVDLDIYSPASGTNTAYLVANTGTTAAATSTSLYTVNLATGAAMLVGLIGNGIAARDIAVAAASGVSLATRPAADLAAELSLYPNPLTDGTSLGFTLARPARVELVVSDVLGRTLATVDAGQLGSGPQTVRWTRGAQAAGLYFVTLRLDGQPAGTRTAVVE